LAWVIGGLASQVVVDRRREAVDDRRMRTSMTGFLLLAGCAGDAAPGDDDCKDLGCASVPGTFTLTVLDGSTQTPVGGELMFTMATSAGPAPAPFACTMVDIDPCPSWVMSLEGSFDVSVVEPSHQAGMIHVVIEGPTGCCGTGPQTTGTLVLQPL
jgi:hypothetical protein